MNISEIRRRYHHGICSEIVRIRNSGSDNPYPNFADGSSALSCTLAWGILERIGDKFGSDKLAGQTVGKRFEVATMEFLKESFSLLAHIRPGDWEYACEGTAISRFDQYHHLQQIEQLFRADAELRSAFGGNYVVRPDIVVSRMPISDAAIDENGILSSSSPTHASFTPLRSVNQETSRPILHAVISCKWTIRNDRAQNTRTEVLNLIRNRKGNLPHVVAVTAEPFPSRIAALALGTGDLDCVYHMALPELTDAIKEIGSEESREIMDMMVSGRRLRDISDLPFDLAI